MPNNSKRRGAKNDLTNPPPARRAVSSKAPAKTALKGTRVSPPGSEAPAARRGRPPKNTAATPAIEPQTPRRRGRPPKNPQTKMTPTATAPAARKRGRPPRLTPPTETPPPGIAEEVAAAAISKVVKLPIPPRDPALTRMLAASQEQIRFLREDIGRLAQLMTGHDQSHSLAEENADLRKQVETLRQENRAWCDDMEKTEEKLAAEIRHWRDKALEYERQLEDHAVARPECLYLPQTYDELPGWVERELTGGLILHPRAIRSLRSAKFKDVPLVAHVLRLLADSYRRMKMGDLDKEIFDSRLNSLHLRLHPAISPIRAGEQPGEYHVCYPENSGKKEFLSMHIRNCSQTLNPERCLAIYFFWDNERKLVVVGALPGHLTTRVSN